MTLVKRNQDLMPSLFSELLDWNNWSKGLFAEAPAMPKMNVTESAEDFQLELCVPGLKKEDLSLYMDADNNLVVEVVQQNEKKEGDQEGECKRHYLRREFSAMQFKQLLAIPSNVKKEQIAAKVEHGVLLITLPKVTEEEKKALTMPIQVA